MRCRACNVILTDFEATRKYDNGTNDYLDLCNHCFSFISDELNEFEERHDLFDGNEDGDGLDESSMQDLQFED